MSWRLRSLLLPGVPLLLGVTACTLGAQGDGTARVEVLQSSSHCEVAGSGFGLELAVDQADFADLARKARTGGPAPALELGVQFGALVSMGERPTGGHALELYADEAAVSGGVATVALTVIEPGPHDLVTMALTTPCLLLRLTGDDIDALRLVDATTGNELVRRSLAAGQGEPGKRENSNASPDNP